MPTAKYRHYGCRIIDELQYKGMRTIILENEILRVGILLDKGADIFQFLYKPTDTDFLWRSPNGLINPQRASPSISSSAGKFLDNYHGGWQEIFPGGGPFNYRGAEIGLHGEVNQLGWDYEILEDSDDCVSVLFSVNTLRVPFRLEKIMRLETGKPVLFFEEKLINLSKEEQIYMWGHHPAFGAPFLHEGVRLFVPAEKGEVHQPRFAESGIFSPGNEFTWPNIFVNGKTTDLSCIPSSDAGYADLIYLKELKEGWYAIVDPDEEVGFGLAWPVDVFPHLWFWLVYGSAPGYPWWNQVYCIALEPWTSIPNSFESAQESRSVAHLEGGGSIEIAMTAVVTTKKKAIKKVEIDGTYE